MVWLTNSSKRCDTGVRSPWSDQPVSEFRVPASDERIIHRGAQQREQMRRFALRHPALDDLLRRKIEPESRRSRRAHVQSPARRDLRLPGSPRIGYLPDLSDSGREIGRSERGRRWRTKLVRGSEEPASDARFCPTGDSLRRDRAGRPLSIAYWCDSDVRIIEVIAGRAHDNLAADSATNGLAGLEHAKGAGRLTGGFIRLLPNHLLERAYLVRKQISENNG